MAVLHSLSQHLTTGYGQPSPRSRSRFAAVLLATALIVSPTSNMIGLPSIGQVLASPIKATSPAHEKVKAQFKAVSPKDWQDWFWLYRTVEHLARANNLSNFNWRIGVMPAPDVNAFATEINLVMAHFGLLDQVANDDAALAFIMGHEMAHNKLRHVALRTAYSQEQNEKYNREAETEIQKLIAQERKKKTGREITGWITGATCGLFGKGCKAVQLGSLLINGKPDPAKVEAKKKEIIARKQEEFTQSLMAKSRSHEFEADREGYFYMARAGYDTNGCLRALEILSRLPGSESNSTHPDVPARIEAIKQLIRDYPPSSLAAEGRRNLTQNSVPLSIEPRSVPYNLKLDARRNFTIPTVRINAKF
jgi:beta-barrel assembly-enhancing protease